MVVIGIVGGIASGKSFVSDELRQLGAEVLDADRAGHEVLREPEVEAAVRRRWGSRVFAPDGRVDRRRVAEIVFAPEPHGPPELEYLESLTHPRIRERLREQIQRLRERGDCPAAVLDAPVMMKAGWDQQCDVVVYVDASLETRLERVRQRGWSEAELAARESSQIPLEEKRRRSSAIIDNGGSPEATRQRIRDFWRSFVEESAS